MSLVSVTAASPSSHPESPVSDDRPLPLSGVRVLDLGHVFQGPYAAFLMAMAGAEVIKVEPPHGDMSRKRARDGDYPFRAINGCKRGIVLNLKTEKGRELLLELSKSADVLLENFAPTVMPRLGLSAEDFWKVNPRLIYASASGFGRTGPYRDKLALDLTVQAMSGLMSTTGEHGGRPLKAGAPVADFMSGAHLYGAVVTALFERERTGRGRLVELSMLEAMFAPLLPAAGHAYASNTLPKRTGNRHLADSYVPFDTFEASDGWVTIVAATNDHWLKLAHAMDRPDLANDPELRDLHGRVREIERVTAEIAAWTSTRTRDQIAATLEAHRIPSAPLRDVMDVLNDPHLIARGFLTQQATPNGKVALPNSPMRYEGSELRPLGAPPELGEHTAEILSEFCGLNKAEIEELRRAGVLGDSVA